MKVSLNNGMMEGWKNGNSNIPTIKESGFLIQIKK